ncbi:MAG: ribonuclease D [Deltaproteobacteria bacterium]|nr:ribonuclease D [Deltaproteobacteria bacterium]
MRKGDDLSSELITTQDALDGMAQRLAGASCIAFDLECASNLHRYVGRVCLMQLATHDEVFLVDTLLNLNLKPIQRILENSAVEIVIHDTGFDLRSLDCYYGWRPNHIFDTLIAARLCGHQKFGLASLLEHFFEVTSLKKFQRADWTKRPLSEEMLSYAALDVSHLVALRDLFAEQLEKNERMEWASAIFERSEETRFEPDERPLFERVKRARISCDGRELAIVQELAILRDEIAREFDLPHFRIFRDEVLIALATDPPVNAQALASRPGLHPQCQKRYAPRLIEAIDRGKRMPELCYPPSKKHPRLSASCKKLLVSLREWREREASRLGVEENVILSTRSLKRLAGGEGIDTVLQEESINAWQGERIARELRDLISEFKNRSVD